MSNNRTDFVNSEDDFIGFYAAYKSSELFNPDTVLPDSHVQETDAFDDTTYEESFNRLMKKDADYRFGRRNLHISDRPLALYERGTWGSYRETVESFEQTSIYKEINNRFSEASDTYLSKFEDHPYQGQMKRVFKLRFFGELSFHLYEYMYLTDPGRDSDSNIDFITDNERADAAKLASTMLKLNKGGARLASRHENTVLANLLDKFVNEQKDNAPLLTNTNKGDDQAVRRFASNVAIQFFDWHGEFHPNVLLDLVKQFKNNATLSNINKYLANVRESLVYELAQGGFEHYHWSFPEIVTQQIINVKFRENDNHLINEMRAQGAIVQSGGKNINLNCPKGGMALEDE